MKQPREGRAHAAGSVLDALLARLGKPEQARLARLWQNWSMVMGPDIAPLAWPLGHRNSTLLVGGEDAMVMQELSMLAGEMLERANAFMDAPFFTDVKVSLALGKNPLDSIAAVPETRPRPVLEIGPPPTGSHLAEMDPQSPVARCYARFAGKSAGTPVSPEDHPF